MTTCIRSKHALCITLYVIENVTVAKAITWHMSTNVHPYMYLSSNSVVSDAHGDHSIQAAHCRDDKHLHRQ